MSFEAFSTKGLQAFYDSGFESRGVAPSGTGITILAAIDECDPTYLYDETTYFRDLASLRDAIARASARGFTVSCGLADYQVSPEYQDTYVDELLPEGETFPPEVTIVGSNLPRDINTGYGITQSASDWIEWIDSLSGGRYESPSKVVMCLDTSGSMLYEQFLDVPGEVFRTMLADHPGLTVYVFTDYSERWIKWYADAVVEWLNNIP